MAVITSHGEWPDTNQHAVVDTQMLPISVREDAVGVPSQTMRQARPIFSAWRWSDPQQPPMTAKCEWRRRIAPSSAAKLSGSPASSVVDSFSSAWLLGEVAPGQRAEIKNYAKKLAH
jgi:hypothetical protein